MDSIPYRIAEYHRMVWMEAGKEILEYYLSDPRNFAGNIVVAILSGLVYAYWSYVWVGTVIDWLGVVVSVLAGFVGWALLLLVGNVIIKTPAKLYRSRETEAWLSTWNDIEIKSFTFPIGHRLENRVGIEVISHKNARLQKNGLQEYSIEVGSVLIEEFGIDMHTEYPRKQLHLLIWEQDGFRKTTSILNRRDLFENNDQVRHLVVPVAQWDDLQAWIATTDEEKNLQLEFGKTYSVVIDFRNWTIQMSNPIDYACSVTCQLRYVENSNKKEVKLRILKRNPEFAYYIKKTGPRN